MEMRVLAHMCGDPGMLQLFRSVRGDIYRELACRLFNKPGPADVTDMERTQAKTICLGEHLNYHLNSNSSFTLLL